MLFNRTGANIIIALLWSKNVDFLLWGKHSCMYVTKESDIVARVLSDKQQSGLQEVKVGKVCIRA